MRQSLLEKFILGGDISKKGTIVMLSKRSATNGWRVAPKDFLPKMPPRLQKMTLFMPCKLHLIISKNYFKICQEQ